jgi:hypothetical protein
MNLITCVTTVVPCPEADQRILALGDALDPVSLGITTADVLAMFSWGFGAVLMFWLLGMGLSVALGLIRKL